MYMKGGSLSLSHRCNILLPDTDSRWTNRIFSDKCVQYFIENITSIRGISNSSLYGVIFTIHLSPSRTIQDVFINDQVENTGIPIRTILMKITYIKHSSNPDQRITRPSRINKAWATIDEFKTETQTQQNIYAETSQLGEPVCPSILHSEILNLKNSIKLLNKLHPLSDVSARGYIEEISQIMTHNTDIVLGVSFMDFMDGYQQLHSLLSDTSNDITLRREVAACAVYQNIRLMSLGYVHSDLHLANTMVNMSRQNLLLGRSYKCIIIDFGRSVYKEELVLDMLKLNVEFNTQFLGDVLSVLYEKHRNSEFPENYLIPSLQTFNIFSSYSDLLPYLLRIFGLRIAKIDELAQQNKYSDNREPLCVRSYIDKHGNMSISGLTFTNVYYIQYGDQIEKKTFHIDIQKKLPFRSFGKVLKTTFTHRNILSVLDFDISIYYISKNPQLINKSFLNLIKDYYLFKRTGKFNNKCDMNQLYLNAITKSDKYTVGTMINPVLNQYYTEEQRRLSTVVSVPPTLEKRKAVLTLREQRFQKRREKAQTQVDRDMHIRIYNNIGWVINQLMRMRNQEPFIQILREYLTLFENTQIPDNDRFKQLEHKLVTFKLQYNKFITEFIQNKINIYNTITQNIETYTARICSQSHPKCALFVALVNHYKTTVRIAFDNIIKEVQEIKILSRLDVLSELIVQYQQVIKKEIASMKAGRRKTMSHKKSKRKTRKN